MGGEREGTAAALIAQLRAAGNDAKRAVLQRFFRTGPGQYGEHDIFLGVTVPQVRRSIRSYRDLPLPQVALLLQSALHEVRLAGLLVLVDRYRRADAADRDAIVRFYLAHLDAVNNWDLVDSSAPHLVGAWLQGRNTALLTRLARSGRLWHQRIAVVATHAFIRNGQTQETFRIARMLLHHEHDLIHKAVGWMLREAGKRDPDGLDSFLRQHAATMPRTMLRYAIEHLPAVQRGHFMTRPRRR